MNDAILQEIADFCRQTGLAESTFGRRAVNDGKLANRLRNGGRITTDTLDRIRAFMARSIDAAPGRRRMLFEQPSLSDMPSIAPPSAPAAGATNDDPARNFRFFDNRQQYLLFVNPCSQKWEIPTRVGLELANIHPRPPALRVFDAGVGDGSVLSRVMRSMHGRFPHMPFYVAGKELSLEDVRLTLDKVPDRLFEHPATVFVLTNMHYAEAPTLTPASPAAAAAMMWHEVPLRGGSSGEFADQIAGLGAFLEDNWRASI